MLSLLECSYPYYLDMIRYDTIAVWLEEKGIVHGASKLRQLLNDKFSLENLPFVMMPVLWSMIDCPFLQFLPWRDSTLYREQGVSITLLIKMVIRYRCATSNGECNHPNIPTRYKADIEFARESVNWHEYYILSCRNRLFPRRLLLKDSFIGTQGLC